MPDPYREALEEILAASDTSKPIEVPINRLAGVHEAARLALSKESITAAQHQQLLGLFELHRRALDEQRRIEAAVAEIVGQEDEGYGYYGLATDELSEQQPSVNRLLERLEIVVLDSGDQR